MPGISWFSPGKWSFCASNGKISEFKTCDNKFTWTSCSQKEHEGKLSAAFLSGYPIPIRIPEPYVCIADKVSNAKVKT